jgi:hypothetical protein
MLNHWISSIYDHVDAAPERLYQIIFTLIGSAIAWFLRGKFDEQRSREQHSIDVVSKAMNETSQNYRQIIEMQANTIRELERRVAVLESRLNEK